MKDEKILHQVSENVSFQEGQHICQELLKIAQTTKNAIGLAAIQIGVPSNVFITKFFQKPSSLNSFTDYTWEFWINPEIEKEEVLSQSTKSVERCLSLRESQAAIVNRKEDLLVSRATENGREKFVLYGLEAIIFQHEFDHLQGKLISDSGTLIDFTIGRNDLCFCGSGKKYKKCCETIVLDSH